MSDLIILGGTFDPIHKAHLSLVHELYALFNTPVCLIPTGIQSYKSASIATKAQRLEMLQIIVKTYPKQMYLDLIEINHPELNYTYKTLLAIRQQPANKNSRLFFTIGLDSLLNFHTWQNFQKIMQLTNIIIALRPGYKLDHLPVEVKDLLQDKLCILTKDSSKDLPKYGKFLLLNSIELDISSTTIRQMCHAKQDVSHLIHPAINTYIQTHHLYL